MSQFSPQAWYAIQVKYQMEKIVASMLEGKGYEKFLPMYTVRKRWSDRIQSVELPLFPGYIFCRMGETARGMIKSTPGIIQIVAFGGRPYPISDLDIDAMRRISLLGSPHPTSYCTIGQRVRIEHGPLSGITGILKQVRNGHILIVSVDMITKSVSISVDECAVCPAGETEPSQHGGALPMSNSPAA